MNKPFNPFREALVYLHTADSVTNRGGVHQYKDPVVYVCWALSEVKLRSYSALKQDRCRLAVRHIESILGEGNATVDDWLRCRPSINRQLNKLLKAGYREYRAVIQDYRWRWLNSMADAYDAGTLVLQEQPQ